MSGMVIETLRKSRNILPGTLIDIEIGPDIVLFHRCRCAGIQGISWLTYFHVLFYEDRCSIGG